MSHNRAANSQRADLSQSARKSPLLRRLFQLLGAEFGYRDARHVRRFFCFSCDKRTFLEHVHTDAFVRQRRRSIVR